jgi:hypothetical protein
MVYYSGGKMARNAASIVNRPTCGGPKKGGLAPTIGNFNPFNPSSIGATNTQFGLRCVGNYTNSSQQALRAIRRY